jgi:hypothetical protein
MEPSSAVTTFLAIFRVVKEMAKQRKLADVSEKLQELYAAFIDIQHQISTLDDENRRLQGECEQLKNIKDIESQLRFDGKVYWRTLENNRTGPFCPNCWHHEHNRRLVPLQHLGEQDYICSIDKTEFRRSSAFLAVSGGPSRFSDIL